MTDWTRRADGAAGLERRLPEALQTIEVVRRLDSRYVNVTTWPLDVMGEIDERGKVDTVLLCDDVVEACWRLLDTGGS